MKKGKILVVVFLLFIGLFSSCTTESRLPVGPDIGETVMPLGRLEIHNMNLVLDFDGTPSAPGLIPSNPVPSVDSGIGASNTVTFPGTNNKYMQMEFVIGDTKAYCAAELGLGRRGAVNLYDYGNALMIRARTFLGEKSQKALTVRFEHERPDENYNFYYSVIYLTDKWEYYIIKFEDTNPDDYFYHPREFVFSHNINIRFEVPHSLSIVNKKGVYQIDDVYLIECAESR